jgi:hypothetical protein
MNTKAFKRVLEILKRYALYGHAENRVANTKLINKTIFFLYKNENWGRMFYVIQRALNRAFRRACENNDVGIFIILLSLKKKINLNKRDEFGDTILMAAVKKSHYSIAENLLFAGASPNIFNCRGYTPLMTAAFNENVKIVELLMENGANVLIESNGLETAESFANWRGNKLIAEMVRVEPKY